MYAEFRKFPRLHFYGKAGTSPFYSAPHSNIATTAAGTNTNLNKTSYAGATPGTHTASVSRQKSGLRRMFRDTTKNNKLTPKATNTL